MDLISRPAHFSPETTPALTCATPPDLEGDLLKAVRKQKKNAIRYLVVLGISTDDAQLRNAVLSMDAQTEEHFKGLHMLGDVLFDHQRYEESILIYQAVIRKIGAPEEYDNDVRLTSSKVMFALGKAYLFCPGDTKFREAESQFKNVIKQLDRNKQEGKERIARNTRSEDPATLATATKSSTNTPVKRFEDNQRRDNVWYRLEIRCIAHLALVYTELCQFDDAANIIQEAMNDFGRSEPDIEVFQMGWVSSDIQLDSKIQEDKHPGWIYEKAYRRFRLQFRENDLIVAIVALHLGTSLIPRQDFSRAKELLSEAIRIFSERSEGKHEVLLSLSHYHLGMLYRLIGKSKDAKRELDRAHSVFSRLENAHWLNAGVSCELARNELGAKEADYEKAKSLFFKTHGYFVKNRNHPRLQQLSVQAGIGLASIEHSKKKYENATTLCDRVLKLIKSSGFPKPDCLEEFEVRVILGKCLEARKKPDLAEIQLKMAAEGFERLCGRKSLNYLKSARELAAVQIQLRSYHEAEVLLSAVLEGYIETFGPHHGYVFKTRWELARLNQTQRKLDSAEKNCRMSYEGFAHSKKNDSRWVIETAKTLGSISLELGKLTQAKAMFEKVNDTLSRAKGSKVNVADQARAAMDLAHVLAVLNGEHDTLPAIQHYKRVTGTLNLNPADIVHQRLLLRAEMKLADLLRQDQELVESRKGINKVLQQYDSLLSETPDDEELKISHLEAKLVLVHLDVVDCMDQTESSSDQDHDRLQIARDSLEEFESKLGDEHELTLEAKCLLGELYLGFESEEDWESGEKLLEDALNTYEKTFAPGHPKAIRLMDCLITHYADRYSDQREAIKNMKKKKYQALRSAYGADTAALVMTITTPKRVIYESDDYSSENEMEEDSDGDNSQSDSEFDLSDFTSSAEDDDMEEDEGSEPGSDSQRFQSGDDSSAEDAGESMPIHDSDRDTSDGE
jgi:tetratricopeptide (TPR) repeat protein